MWFGRGLGAVPGGESAKRHTMLVPGPFQATFFSSLLPSQNHQNDPHFTNIPQFQRISQGFQRISEDSIGFQRISEDFTRISEDFRGFHWISENFTGFQRIS